MRESQGQIAFFSVAHEPPEGFKYQADILSSEDEQLLLDHMRQLPFREFQFQGFVGKRRVVSYGWQYDFKERALRQAEDIPSFLLPLREARRFRPDRAGAARTGAADRIRCGREHRLAPGQKDVR